MSTRECQQASSVFEFLICSRWHFSNDFLYNSLFSLIAFGAFAAAAAAASVFVVFTAGTEWTGATRDMQNTVNER